MKDQIKSSFQLDIYLLLAVIGLLMVGLVMVTSSSMVVALHDYGNSFHFIIRQVIFAFIAVGCAIGMLSVDTDKWYKMGPIWLIGGILLLIMVLIPGIGHVVNGSRRWIDLGPIAIQVSELVKLCAVMYVASYLVRHGDVARNTFFGVIKPIGVLGIIGVLLLMEPDFGATVVVFTTALGMMFMAGVRLRWFYILIILAVGAAVMLVLFSPYRLARLTGFLHPWNNQFDTGYQLTQSLIAFGRGGWFGVGLGGSIQKLFYLPEAYTDFVLAVIAEELGFVGVLCVLGLFVVVGWRGLVIARQAHYRNQAFDAFVAYGITFWLGMQVMVNIGVNIGLLPTKGLTLPFISYGGSSLVVDCMVIGILLRIDMQNKLASMGAVLDKIPGRKIRVAI
ncbi:MAG: putative lipid II flippase FtsW [Gammaproteobacteria bacterium]|nr:putative lipid II flippase FtsW [Gammaproteobacteria bacterium]